MLSKNVVNQVARELAHLADSPCDGLKVTLNEENMSEVCAELEGPAGTPYEGGVFRMKLSLPSDFPTTPPKGYFLTKIFHPNVSKSGEICVNVLKRDWTPDLGLKHVLMVIRCLLIQPFPDSALNEEAGRLLHEDYEDYFSKAKLMTQIHAVSKRERPTPLTTSSGANATDGAAAAQAAGGKPGKTEASSPLSKKPKAASKAGKANNKRALRRL